MHGRKFLPLREKNGHHLNFLDKREDCPTSGGGGWERKDNLGGDTNVRVRSMNDLTVSGRGEKKKNCPKAEGEKVQEPRVKK